MARVAMMLIGAVRTLLTPQQSLMHSPALLHFTTCDSHIRFLFSVHVTLSQFTLLAVIGYGWDFIVSCDQKLTRRADAVDRASFARKR